jgi:hypothetical protein
MRLYLPIQLLQVGGICILLAPVGQLHVQFGKWELAHGKSSHLNFDRVILAGQEAEGELN